MVYGWLERLRQAAWPGRCLVCDEAGLPGRDLCAACLAALPVALRACRCCGLPLGPAEAVGMACGACLARPPPLTVVVAAFLYAWPGDGLLRRFKFHQDLAAGRALAQLMLARCAMAEQPQALVPVSLHRSRLRRRGYDQAWELAQPLARALRLPCLPLLQRLRPTLPQSELDAEERAHNLGGAFAAHGPVPAHVALVDDVMTTGATLHAAARALQAAGARRVDAWVCARVP